MAYTVLARKYRPQRFSDLVGQEHVTRTIGNAIASGRVAHAYLFTGARGVGKTSTARLLAKALNCVQGPTTAPCNECDACREITAGTDLDVLEIDGASNNSVEDVRRLQESLPYRPNRDRFKVVIVDEVHMLSSGAFNAFLKTLEEPPSHVKFIFATTEVHKVPITIRSRCQRHDFRLIPNGVVAEHIRAILAAEGIEADDSGVAIVAREAAGSMRDALTVLDQVLAFGGGGLRGEEVTRGLGIAGQERVLEVADAVLSGDPATCLRAMHELAEQGLDVLHFARQLLSLMRDLVVLKVAGDDPALVSLEGDERRQAAEVAGAHPGAELERAFVGLSEVVDRLGTASQPGLSLEMGLVRLSDRPRLRDLGEVMKRLEAIAGGVTRGGAAGGGGAGRPPRASRSARASRTPEAAGPPDRDPSAAGPGSAAGPEPSATRPAPRASRPPAEAPKAPGPGAVHARTEDSTKAARAPTDPDPTPDGVPPGWARLVRELKDRQPALGAILEHGVGLEVTPERLRIGFPEGSFFGRQARAKGAQEAILQTAEALLGTRPTLEIAQVGADAGETLASVEAAERSGREQARREAAMNHPRVRDALEVFPETRDNVEVRIDPE